MNKQKKNKVYWEKKERLENLAAKALQGQDEETQKKFSLCLAELYSRSGTVIQLIDELGDKRKHRLNKENVDFLLSKLIELKIELFDEITDWLKELRKPLNKIVKEIKA